MQQKKIRLSVNVNKVATLRNSRGGNIPDVVRSARACVAAGAGGITVHPRADGRHIRSIDVHALSKAFAGQWGTALEFNIEGDPRDDWLSLVSALRPTQATLVPVRSGELTSEAGWSPERDARTVDPAVSRLKARGVRVSLFVDPTEEAIRFAQRCGADRVELYTEPFAREFERGDARAQESFKVYARAASLANELGLGVNAGHDLDSVNLKLFGGLPHLDEVSIGHALWSEAIFKGIDAVIADYLKVLQRPCQ